MTTTLTNNEVTSIIFVACVLIIFIAFLLGELYSSTEKNKTLSEEVKVLKTKLNTKNLNVSIDKSTGVLVAVTALGLALTLFLEKRKEKKAAKELAEKREIELVKAVSFGWSFSSFSPNKKYNLDDCVKQYRKSFITNQQ